MVRFIWRWERTKPDSFSVVILIVIITIFCLIYICLECFVLVVFVLKCSIQRKQFVRSCWKITEKSPLNEKVKRTSSLPIWSKHAWRKVSLKIRNLTHSSLNLCVSYCGERSSNGASWRRTWNSSLLCRTCIFFFLLKSIILNFIFVNQSRYLVLLCFIFELVKNLSFTLVTEFD